MSIVRLFTAALLTLTLAACQTTGSTANNYASVVKNISAATPAAMPVGPEVVPPYGYISFCQRNPGECENTAITTASIGATAKGMALNPARWAELDEINNFVNRAVRPVEDRALYKKVEWWNYPQNDAGDCEDYVLLKRKLLIDRGWPASALLITVVKEWSGAGHAVLLAITDKGEYVLDNQSWSIVTWQDAPYTWVKRQSQAHPYVWVNLNPASFATGLSREASTKAPQSPSASVASAAAQTSSLAAN